MTKENQKKRSFCFTSETIPLFLVTRSSRLNVLCPVALLLLVLTKTQFSTMTKEMRELEPAVVEPEEKIMRREDFAPPAPSAYTNRTGQPQPSWARKYFFLPQPNKSAGDKSLCFVHVGKTAGTTIACYLGFRYRGEEQFMMPKGRLRDNTVHAFHNWINDCPDDDDYYLFATRDPISRIQSWFTYERPLSYRGEQDIESLQQKRLFIDCPFPHLNNLAEDGLGDNPTVPKTCRKRAFDAIRGYRIFYRHNFYNYQWYLDHVPKEKPLMVLRQEYLATDWTSAEAFLARLANDTSHFAITFPHRNRSPIVAEADKYLSEKALKNLCAVLCKEIQAYKTILDRSVNLSPEDKAASLESLGQKCPREVEDPKCDSRLFEEEMEIYKLKTSSGFI